MNKLLSKIKLKSSDPDQEREYHRLKLPFMKEFYLYLCVALGLLLLPLIIRYFDKHLIPQAYIGISIAIFAGVIFMFRKQLYRYLELLALAIICAIIGISITNTRILVNAPDNVNIGYFYMGYALSSMHRLLGYGVFRFQIMISFQIVTFILRMTLVNIPDVTLLLVLIGQELFVAMISYAVEKNERGLFESLYKSNKLLLKFKTLITEYLPNQILIFSNDYSNLHFHNDAFKKAFKCDEVPKIKTSLSRLILDADSVEKNKSLIAQLGYFEDQPINLSDFIDSVSQNLHLIRGDTEILSVQVTEKEGEEFDLSKTKEAFPKSSKRSAHGYEQVFSPSFPKDKEALIKTKQTIPSLNDGKLARGEVLPTETENLVAHTKLESENVTIVDKETEKNSFRDSNVDSSLDENKRRIFVVKIFTLVWDNSEALAILMDNVTHERTIMELKVADKNKDMIITMISHELRTPLNGILGLIDISKKMLKQADVVPYINACKNSGILLLNLVNSILDLSQIKAHKLRLFYTEFSVNELIGKIVPLFDYFCLIKKLFLRIDVDPNVPATIITDKNRLSQILINLIGNAFKFTFQGGITLKVELEDDITNRIKFTVKDTGIGIEKDKQNRLFNPERVKLFGRIDNQNEKINTNGVGLGLTISNTLAILLDPLKKGIQVDSSLGVGSSFFFVVQSKPPEVLKNAPTEEKSWDDIHSGLLEEDRDLTVSKKVNTYTTNSIKTLLKPIETDKGVTSVGEFAVSHANFLSLSPQKVSNDLETYAKPWCMIVDDNPFNLVVATHIMQERGYQIVTALNGKEALTCAQKAREDGKVLRVILMDCQMPVMDGYQATKNLTEMMKEELVDKCPIIALTANHQSDKHTKLCNEVGMSGCLSKPLQIDELEDMLKKVESKKV